LSCGARKFPFGEDYWKFEDAINLYLAVGDLFAARRGRLSGGACCLDSTAEKTQVEKAWLRASDFGLRRLPTVVKPLLFLVAASTVISIQKYTFLPIKSRKHFV
jgi:hypothetical protein